MAHKNKPATKTAAIIEAISILVKKDDSAWEALRPCIESDQSGITFYDGPWYANNYIGFLSP